MRAENVLQVPYDAAAIKQAIWRCLHDDAFRAQVRQCANPYQAGNAGRRIADVLASTPIDARLIQKRMTY